MIFMDLHMTALDEETIYGSCWEEDQPPDMRLATTVVVFLLLLLKDISRMEITLVMVMKMM